MTRIHHARPQHAAQRSITLDQPRAVAKKKKPYKIVLEAVTQEKKKLHSIVRRHQLVPSHSTDLLSAYLRLECSQRIWICSSRTPRVYRMVQRAMPPTQSRRAHCFGPQQLFTVRVCLLTQQQAKPKNRMHADPEKLSHHVHRVGHHFPLEIVNLACSKFGYIYDEAQGLRKDKSRDRTNWIAQRVEDYSSRQVAHGRPTTEKESKEHTRGAVREMFPKIPEADLTSIVNHAFEEVFS
jgi:hypothetical protein